MKKYILIAVFLLSCVFARGQSPLWDSVGSGLNYAVRNMYYDSVTNKIYISTQSAYTGDSLPIYGIGVWDGIKWDTLGIAIKPTLFTGSILSWFALAACRYDNKLFFGGNFQNAGGKTIKYIATWDGVEWDSLPEKPNGIIFDMIVYHGKLYICGQFTAIGNDNTYRYVARWNGNNWEHVGNEITSIAHHPVTSASKFCIYNDELYVAGQISDLNNMPIHIVKWNDTVWSYVGNGIQSGGITLVWDMAVYNNELWIGGRFPASATGTSNYLTRWDGTQFKSIGGSGFNQEVLSLHVHNGKLYAGGAFTTINSLPATSIAVFDGQDWCSLGSDMTQFDVRHMATLNDTLYVGSGSMVAYIDGEFFTIAKWAGGNYIDTCKNANLSVEENIYSEQNDIHLYPNPNTGNFNLVFSSAYNKPVAIRVFNNLGQCVYQKSLNQVDAGSIIQISAEDLASGLYVLRLDSEKQMQTTKFIISK